MITRKAALAATLALGAAAPAWAQYPPAPARPATTQTEVQAQQQPAAPQRVYDLTRAERAALQPMLNARTALDWPAAIAAIPAAEAAARGADAKYLVGLIQFQAGTATSNAALRSQGIDGMLASGGVPLADQVGIYTEQATIAAAAGDIAKADRALDQVIALSPQDELAVPRAAQMWVDNNNVPHALEFFQRHIDAAVAAGRPIPADVRRLHMVAAYRARLPQTLPLMRAFVAAAPTNSNWHDALLIYREFHPDADGPLKLDIYRLMRAANALTAERDFVEYADAANSSAAFGEAKEVLERGLAANLITGNIAYARAAITTATTRIASDRPSLAADRATALAGTSGTAVLRMGDAYYGYGEYAPAAELYRAALQKGGVDANLVNLRLGAALAQTGQRAEAETAFRAVTGPRAELAQLWLLWLATPRT
jgi:Tfp pilus assembly protein PilF